MAKLKDTELRAIKATGKAQKLFDGEGLYLYVSPKGGKTWRIDYRVAGKYKTLTLGAYPSITLANARKHLAEVKEKLVQGIDPSVQKQAIKSALRAETQNAFEVVALEWIENKKHTWTAKHQGKIISRLSTYIFPLLGHKDVKEITAPELLDALRKIEQRGFLDTAHATLNTCGQIFRYAIATGRGERDTAADLRGALKPLKQGNYPSIKDPKEIGILLNNIDEYHGNFIVRTALQIAPYVFVRPSELRCAVIISSSLKKRCVALTLLSQIFFCPDSNSLFLLSCLIFRMIS